MVKHPTINSAVHLVSVHYGYLLPTRENVMRGKHDTKHLIARAQLAESLGFDSVWVGDSLIARPRHDPLTLLAGVASVVPRVKLGTAVLLPALRNPVILAQQLATIDQLSEGRLIVGAGIAADAPAVRAEFQAASVPFEKRVGRLVEGFNLCRALWQGEPVSWAGRWNLNEATLGPVPYQSGGPPIWLASSVEPGIRRIAQHFDGWFPIGPNADVVGTQHQLLVNTATELKRNVPVTAVYLTVCLADSTEQANQQIDDYLLEYYNMPANILRSIQACFGGTAEQIATFVQEFVDAGAEHIVLRLVGEHDHALRTLSKQFGL